MHIAKSVAETMADGYAAAKDKVGQCGLHMEKLPSPSYGSFRV